MDEGLFVLIRQAAEFIDNHQVDINQLVRALICTGPGAGSFVVTDSHVEAHVVVSPTPCKHHARANYRQ